MTRQLLEGSEAIAASMIAAGCRFFAGYPMTPFTEVLEHMAAKLPAVGGVCMNAESELEAVGMAWGAAATGTYAATGSTGQGLSLMQESLAEISLARVPLVVLNMARAQGDYYQATRGGGHGDYRHLVLAPVDITETVELTQLAFHLADRWRNPVLVYGDYLTAHVEEALARLVEAYMALGITKEAQNAAALLGHNYPDSKWYKDSYALLQSDGLAPRDDSDSWLSKARNSVPKLSVPSLSWGSG